MRDDTGTNTPGTSPSSESSGNEAWQRTKYLLAQLHGREN
jgi:hypothetical protein